MNSAGKGDNMERQYPTDEELEDMYEEYIRTKSKYSLTNALPF